MVDRGAGMLLAHFYHRIRHGEQGRSNRTIDSCRAETVILGSSRAAHHYVPDIIGAALSSTCYNAGRDKQRLPYCLAVLKVLYARYTPSTIILDLNPTAFNSDENGLSELSVLLPYYQTNPELRSIVDQRNSFEWIKAQSMLYCYNSLALKILFHSVSDERDAGASNGYVPLTTQKEFIPLAPPPLPATFPLDEKLVDCFREIVALARQKKTRLVVVVSPVYGKLPPHLATIEMTKQMARSEQFSFFDFSREMMDKQNGRGAFVDLFHLNDSSARIFSGSLARDILESKKEPR